VVIIDEDDVNAPQNDTLQEFYSIPLITGFTSGSHLIVPGALISANFLISYELGDLIILPSELVVIPDSTTVIEGDPIVVNYSVVGYQYEDADSTILAGDPDFGVEDLNENPLTPPYTAGMYRLRGANLPLQDSTIYTIVYETGPLNILAPLWVVVNEDVSRPSCNSSNGSISLTPSGGVAPYTYVWSDGNQNASRSGLAAGTYSYTVTDNNGNSHADTVGLVAYNCQLVMQRGSVVGSEN
jgi:hypothetical protein